MVADKAFMFTRVKMDMMMMTSMNVTFYAVFDGHAFIIIHEVFEHIVLENYDSLCPCYLKISDYT